MRPISERQQNNPDNFLKAYPMKTILRLLIGVSLVLIGVQISHARGFGGGFHGGGFSAGGFHAGGFEAGGFHAGGFDAGGFHAGGMWRFTRGRAVACRRL